MRKERRINKIKLIKLTIILKDYKKKTNYEV